jgi:hypothetical protein
MRARRPTLLAGAMVILGCVCLAIGAALIFAPLGLLVAGAALLTFGLLAVEVTP